MICTYCGREIPQCSLRRKYCSERCYDAAKKQNQAEWRKNNPEKARESVRNCREKGGKIVTVAKPRDNGLAKADKRARELGLSYGMYQHYISIGKIKDETLQNV